MSFELTSAEIAQISQGQLLKGEGTEFISSFSIDSRTITSGQCFIALRGNKTDGHNFIPEAIYKGAQGVIFEAENRGKIPGEVRDIFLIQVPDTYETVYKLAKYKRKKINFPLLAITGSNGKTTVKELCREFLNKKSPAYKNFLNENNLLGLSLNILNCSGDYQFGVFEIGISQEGEMDKLLEILNPNHGLITNISPTHLQFLGEENNVYREKIKLFKSLDCKSRAFYSQDDKYLSHLKREEYKCENFKTFGFLKKNDYCVNILRLGLKGIELEIEGHKLKTHLLGCENAFNIAAAVAVASEFGVSFSDIEQVLSEFKPLPARLNYLAFPDLDIIDDSYNSNPLSLKAVIRFVSSLKYPGIKIAVVADMLELGRESERLHYELGKEASQYDIDYYFCFGNEMQHFVRGMLEAGYSWQRISYHQSEDIPSQLLQVIKSKGRALVLFKASRGMRIEIVMKEFIDKTGVGSAL